MTAATPDGGGMGTFRAKRPPRSRGPGSAAGGPDSPPPRPEPEQTPGAPPPAASSWRGRRAGERWRAPARLVRVVLHTTEWQAVGVHLHELRLLPTSEENVLVGHLGPDLLGPDWDPTEAVRRLRAQPQRSIGPALLDQRNLAGIGNLYKAETLFLRGVHPWTRVADVPDLATLVDLAHRLMMANKDRWEQATTGDRRHSRRTWVYERGG